MLNIRLTSSDENKVSRELTLQLLELIILIFCFYGHFDQLLTLLIFTLNDISMCNNGSLTFGNTYKNRVNST